MRLTVPRTANAGASVQSEPRMSGRNRIPEKYRRIFAADFRFCNRFPCGDKACGRLRLRKNPVRARSTLTRRHRRPRDVGIRERSAAARFRFAAAQPDLLRPQDKKCRRAKKQTHFLTNIHK